MRVRSHLRRFLLGALSAAVTLPAAAQAPDLTREVTVNSVAERYLRVASLLGPTDVQWSIRGFALDEVQRLVEAAGEQHPWAARFPADSDPGLRFGLIRPEARGIWNSGFAYGWNDGPVWAGRGLTGVASAGAMLEAGPLTLRLEPMIFRSANAEFELVPTGRDDHLRYADPREPRLIDLPQRFGEAPYGRVGLGESTARIDLFGAAAGVSTAAQHWGPAQYFPFILGNNAGGYPHIFFGTSTPVDLRIVRVHGRVVYGVLEASEWADLRDRRFAPAVVVVAQPTFVPGLEVGGGRFFHIAWREGGPIAEDFLRPFEAFLKDRRDRTTGGDGIITSSNQLASAFFRWAFPGSGFEVYGEYARNDHAADLRDLTQQPDHDSGYSLGLLRAWAAGDAFYAVRGEVLNAQRTHLMHGRHQVRFYRHSRLRQGHTHRGQLLGGAAARGGAGSVVELERYAPVGRWAVRWERILEDDDPGAAGGIDWHVLHGVIGEAAWMRRGWDLMVSLGYVHDLRSDGMGDIGNLHLSGGIRIGL
jgi:hypothetical protein